MILRLCPSCGEKFEGDLCLGCPSCGARAVGPPLAKAERELPSFGRAFFAAAIGVLMVGALLAATILVLVQTRPISMRIWAIEYAAETVVWNLKWVELPLLVVSLWISARLARSIREAPDRFTGLWAARSGLIASSLVAVIIGTLIGVTIPDRLEGRRLAQDAKTLARAYTIHRAFIEYRERKGFFPAEMKDLQAVPDPDGSIAEALLDVDPNGYKPSAVLAAASSRVKSQPARGGALRNAVTNSSADELDLSFTSYELRLPGEDKVLGTDDDFIVRADGDVVKASESTPHTNAASSRPSAR